MYVLPHSCRAQNCSSTHGALGDGALHSAPAAPLQSFLQQELGVGKRRSVLASATLSGEALCSTELWDMGSAMFSHCFIWPRICLSPQVSGEWDLPLGFWACLNNSPTRRWRLGAAHSLNARVFHGFHQVSIILLDAWFLICSISRDFDDRLC